MFTLKPDTLKHEQGETFSDGLAFTVDVEHPLNPSLASFASFSGFSAKVTRLKVTVERNVGRRLGRLADRRTEVRIAKNFELEKRLRWIGLGRIAQVPGLRDLVLEAAAKHWAKFVATEAQMKAIAAGAYDKHVTVTLAQHGRGDVFEVVFDHLPFADYTFSGGFRVVAAEDGRITRGAESSGGFTADSTKGDHRDHRWEYAVPSSQHANVIETIQPILRRKVTALAADRRKRVHEALIANVVRAEGDIEMYSNQLRSAQADLKEAKAKLFEHWLEEVKDAFKELNVAFDEGNKLHPVDMMELHTMGLSASDAVKKVSELWFTVPR